jgi:hypothetical protein
VDVWLSVVSGYTTLKKPKTAAQKEARRNNKMEMDAILDGLDDSVKAKVGSCASAKEIWDKLQDIYAKPEAEEVEASYNSHIQEAIRGALFFFNCEEVGHIEHEFPYPRIERDGEENPNEVEDNPEIEKEENHEAKSLCALERHRKELEEVNLSVEEYNILLEKMNENLEEEIYQQERRFKEEINNLKETIRRL